MAMLGGTVARSPFLVCVARPRLAKTRQYREETIAPQNLNIDFLGTLRGVLPKSYRALLIRNRLTNALIKACVRREQSRPHPQCSRQLVFDGHRALGWATGGLATWEHGYFEACRRILRAIKPSVVWDVGANVGIWTIFFADVLPSGAKVFAYEPDEVNLSFLRHNISINLLENTVAVRPLAMSRTPGMADFQADPMTGATGSLEIGDAFITRYYGRPTSLATVATTSADHELADGIPSPDFLKVDVEGHEWQLLLGAQQLLTTVRPVIIMEFTGAQCGIAVRHLRDSGYVILCPHTGKPRESPQYELVAAPLERAAIIRAALAPESR